MVKSLSDVCLDYLRCNIEKLGLFCSNITQQQKETIIQRLAIHEQFTLPSRNIVFQNLFAGSLKDVSLENCFQVDDSFLEKFANCDCRLKSLVLSNCKNVTDKGLAALLNTQPNLKKLTLKCLANVTGKCFASLICPNLWFVNLKASNAVDESGISQLVKKCNRISYLNLVLCTKLDDTTFDCVAGYLLGNLETLKCSYLPLITDETLISLADRCLNLKMIKLHGCAKISSVGVRAIFKACQLAIIDVSYCYKIIQEPDILSDCLPTTLTKVVLRGTQVDRRFLYALSARCKQLQVVELCGIQSLDDEVVGKMLQEFGSGLREIDFSWCSNITDASIQSIIKYCPDATKLTFTCCKGITGEPLSQYAELDKRKQAEKLTRLGLGACPNLKCDVFLDVFPYCVNLEDVRACGQKSFNDDYLFSLAKNCPNLKAIGVKGCTQVTDKGVCELVRYCTRLESLVLSGLHLLTDKSIFFMATSIASSLDSLYISGCSKISHPAVTYLKDVCINYLLVEHKIPNAPPDQLMARNLDTDRVKWPYLEFPNAKTRYKCSFIPAKPIRFDYLLQDERKLGRIGIKAGLCCVIWILGKVYIRKYIRKKKDTIK